MLWYVAVDGRLRRKHGRKESNINIFTFVQRDDATLQSESKKNYGFQPRK